MTLIKFDGSKMAILHLQKLSSLKCCLALAALLCVAPQLFASEQLKVMSINTEWLWTPKDGRVDGIKFNRGDMKLADYKAELRFYSRLIRLHKIRLVALSEIENASVAWDLARMLGKAWSVAFRQGRDTATGQDVALLSDLPLISGSVTDFGFPYGKLSPTDRKKRLSKIVGARYQFQGETVGVVTAHLLSRRHDSAKKRANRYRQAVGVAKAVKQLQGQSDRVICMGDLNDYLNSRTLDLITQSTGLIPAASELTNKKAPGFKKLKWQVDHILVGGFDVVSVSTYDLKSYSDHSAVMAVLR